MVGFNLTYMAIERSKILNENCKSVIILARVRGVRGDGLAEMKSINRTNDYAFKRILGSEEGREALIGFLNAVIKPLPAKN